MRVLVGLDDHDSPRGGCTTHFSTLFIQALLKGKVKGKLLDLPRLVRLNPAIPWKTRGNAAIALVVETNDVKDLFDFLVNFTDEYDREYSKGKNYGRQPSVVVVPIEDDRMLFPRLRELYEKGVNDVLLKDVVVKVLTKVSALFAVNRGVIGSAAALGFNPLEGFTYELLVYRDVAKERPDLSDVIRRLEEQYFPGLFYNYNYVKNDPIALPHGPDPVLLGLRGVNITALLEAYKTLAQEVKEFTTGSMLFVTNQHTGSHIKALRPTAYRNVRIVGVVVSKDVRPGGDVSLEVMEEKSGTSFTAFVFSESGTLSKAAQELVQGDVIDLEGSVKPSATYGTVIEVEAFTPLKLVSENLRNPSCPRCGGSTESLGRGKGFRCRKCGFRFKGEKVTQPISRGLTLTRYISERPRHLTKFDYLEPLRIDTSQYANLVNVLVSVESTGQGLTSMRSQEIKF
jgi:tRNA(Ile2)-agmatinylcytidine synthase